MIGPRVESLSILSGGNPSLPERLSDLTHTDPLECLSLRSLYSCVSLSPYLYVSLSPCLPIPASQCLRVPASPCPRVVLSSLSPSLDAHHHRIRADQVLDSCLTESCLFHPARTIRARVIESCGSLD